MNRERWKRELRTFGVSKTLYDVGYTLLERYAGLMILQGITLEMKDIPLGAFDDDGPFTGRFLEPDEVRGLAQDPAHRMTDAFVQDALLRGHRCYALFDGGTVASTGWYATTPTMIDDTLELSFDPRWPYMYKGYTPPAYRGKRLHGIGMARACRALTAEGHPGLISFILANNFSSLKSSYRIGYRDFGRVRVARLFGRTTIRHGEGCTQYAFTVRAAA